MQIIKRKQLTEEQVRQIRELEKTCWEKDGLENPLFLSNEINYDRDIPVFLMAYEGAALVGFLTFFIPTRDEAEISAIVHPDYRRTGIFTELEEAARRIISENGIERLLYCVEAKSESAHAVLKARGVSKLLRSEYRMTIDVEGKPREAAQTDAVCLAKRLTPENEADYIAIADSVYGDEGEERRRALMTSEDRLGYVFYRNGAPVGIFVIGLELKGKPFLYGVAVAENERGKGYGGLLMQEACRLGGKYGRLLQLDVDSGNPAAFHLYRRIGFEITFQVDYYERG